MPNPTGYSQAQIILHWLTVGLVGLQFLLADGMNHAFDALEKTGTAAPTALSNLHIFGGLAIFVTVAIRLSMRLTRGTPPPPLAKQPVLQILATAAHWAFYGLLIALPVSGAVAWFRASEAAAEAHEVLKAALLAVIALHVAGALYHHFVLKSDLLTRMRHPGA